VRANDGGSSRCHMILGKRCVGLAADGAEDRLVIELGVPVIRCS
jgi:hypothetical protein